MKEFTSENHAARGIVSGRGPLRRCGRDLVFRGELLHINTCIQFPES